MQKKVSIIVPVYNASNNICKCIKSILDQTYKNFELILINDGSKDDSIEILNKYKKEDNRIIVIDKENEGVSITRNKGIALAKGKYIMFIDNDDFIDNNYVEKFVEEIDNTDYDAVFGGYSRVSDKKVLFTQYLSNTEWSKYIIVAPWAKIYKRDFLIKNKIKFLNCKIGEDVYFNINAILKGMKVKTIDYVGYNWYYNNNSVSNTSQKGLNNEVDILYLLNQLKNGNNIKNNEYVKYYINRYYIWYLLYSGKYATKNDFVKEYKRINKWIVDNEFNKHFSPLSRRIKGESLKNRLIVLTFKMIERLNLIGLFSNIYCKGGK